MHPYAYLFGDFFFLFIWGILFFWRKDLRKEMFAMSIAGACIAPLAFVFLLDYWSPEYILGGFPIRIEDFLFAFSVGGIGAVLYESVVRKSHAIMPERRAFAHQINGIFLLTLSIAAFLMWQFRINSIYANYIIFFILFFFMIFQRRDLLLHAFFSGVLVAALMFLFYQVWIPLNPGIIQHWWKLNNISGVLIAGVPLEEIIWGFAWGMSGGILYEYICGFRLRSLRKGG